jgi:hypothetical protein
MAKGENLMLGTLNGETERLLAQGQDAARKGDRPAARSLLTQVVERDPHNELAWMWLSGVVEEPEEQQICLENVLVINPHNAKARRGLEFISTKTGIPPHYPPVPSELGNAAAEFTAPLTDSPMYGELAGQFGQWPPAAEFPASNGASGDAGHEASAALLAWMQTTDTDGAPSDGYAATPAYHAGSESPNGPASQAGAWNVPAHDFDQPFQQEQLDWNQPAADFSALSLAEGVDDRFAQLEAAGGMGFDGSDMPFGGEPFAAAGTALAGGGAAGLGVAGEGATGMAVASGGGAFDGSFNGMGPMGLHSDSNLPSPSDLPRFEERPEQPWYLQGDPQPSSNDDLYASRNLSEPVDGTRQSSVGTKEPGSMVECPHCKALVADTSLSCPQCKFSFFVNCPHCHELVDAADASAGESDCPYCEKPINRMELGLAGTDSVISYKSSKASSDSMSKEAMERLAASRVQKAPISFKWALDVVWLVLIVASVWALSQLPTWLHWTGQY